MKFLTPRIMWMAVPLRYRGQNDRGNKTDECDCAYANLRSLYKTDEDWYLVLRIVGMDLETVI